MGSRSRTRTHLLEGGLKVKITEMQRRPFSRATFERNLFVLRESINQNRVNFVSGVSTDGLPRVRNLPNGRIDFLSVDESTRLQAITLVNINESFGVTGPRQAHDEARDESEEEE